MLAFLCVIVVTAIVGLLNTQLVVYAQTDEGVTGEYQRGGYTLDEIRAMLQQGDIQEMVQRGDLRGFERRYRPDGGPITIQTPEEDVLAFFNALASKSSIQPTFNYAVRPIIGAGRPCEASIVLVLLGDGFTAGHGYGQIGNHLNPAPGTFLRSAHEFAATLVNMYPFSLFRDVFKIYAVETPSSQSGIRIGNGPHQGTYLGTYLLAEWYLRMTDIGRTRALSISNWVSPNAIMTQVIANTRLGGGIAYWIGSSYANINTVGISTRFLGHPIPGWNAPVYHSIVVHEIGHNFGKLVDEHATGFGWPCNTGHANMARATDTNVELKWGHWLGHAGIMRRSVNAPVGYIFPSQNHTCKMEGWQARFCAVCRAELTRRMAMVTGETFEAGRRPDGTWRPATPHVTAQHNRILPYAFHGNVSLNTITIPASINTIGDFAFIGATGLRTINNQRTIPQQINDTTFAGLNRAIINVNIPTGTTAAFRAAGWTGFNLIEEIPFGATLSGNITGYTVDGLDTNNPQTITVHLTGDTFANTLTGNWITNLPHGLTQSVTRINNNTAVITVSGIPAAWSFMRIRVTIPAGALVTNNNTALVATRSVNAVYDIACGHLAWLNAVYRQGRDYLEFREWLLAVQRAEFQEFRAYLAWRTVTQQERRGYFAYLEWLCNTGRCVYPCRFCDTGAGWTEYYQMAEYIVWLNFLYVQEREHIEYLEWRLAVQRAEFQAFREYVEWTAATQQAHRAHLEYLEWLCDIGRCIHPCLFCDVAPSWAALYLVEEYLAWLNVIYQQERDHIELIEWLLAPQMVARQAFNENIECFEWHLPPEPQSLRENIEWLTEIKQNLRDHLAYLEQLCYTDACEYDCQFC